MPDVDAIVIGSGAGGQAAALGLARAGKKVLVLEQHYLPGGWCQTFSLNGFQFNPGVHYIGDLGPGSPVRAMYEGLGVAGDLTFLELNPDGYEHMLIGGERFDVPKGKAALAERLKQRFPREAAGIDGYLDTVDRMSREMLRWFFVDGARDILTAPLPFTVMRHGWRPLDRFLDGFTRDPLLRAILSMQAGDYGVAPSQAPTTLHASIVGHYLDGGYYPKGGAKAITRAFLRQIRAHGGEVRVRAPVERILVEKRRAIGVRLADGLEVRAPIVISNADPHATYVQLVGREHLSSRLRRKLDRTRYSISAITLFLAADFDARAAGLDSGNYWYARDSDLQRVYDLGYRAELPGDVEIPGLFLSVTTLKDPYRRRDRLHTMESWCFVSHEAFRRFAATRSGDRSDEYVELKRRLTDRMLDAISRFIPSIRDKLVFCELATPLTNVHYVGATRGNIYGTEKTLDQLGPFSFPVKSEIDGLFLCGACTIGHGVALAMLSGLNAAKSALGCQRRDLLGAKGSELTLQPCEPAAEPRSTAA